MLTQPAWSAYRSAAFAEARMAQMIMPSAVPADPGRHRAGFEPDHPNTLTSRNNLCRRNRGNESLKNHPQASSFRHDLAGELDCWVSDRSEWWVESAAWTGIQRGSEPLICHSRGQPEPNPRVDQPYRWREAVPERHARSDSYGSITAS
jgi:hypothetical protein